MQNETGNWMAEEDLVLVTAAQEGERDAFAELVCRHQATCMKLAISVLREREDAEDEVQNALFKAYEHLDQFQRDAKFSTWLSRIVLNQCLMRLRQTRRARFLYIDDGHDSDEISRLDLPAHDSSPESHVAKMEISAVLKHEMSRIPPLLRHAFLLRDVQQLPMPEVAERLGVSIAAAKSRLLRARAELKERLGKHCGRLGDATLLAES
jgi:RNA polymerase sigma-70 factor (ECF subfamily)